ncbi:hypothetical protein AALP_AAs58765U000300 [Arabis alpina]|uniref:Secreted protein n=1 Tax=Arabis alpina TaxID=50452 RepID=A0A087G0I3_ARAAL|nr:hypothetical protein AALP_AAs58765U000300 [Arabis alpina]
MWFLLLGVSLGSLSHLLCLCACDAIFPIWPNYSSAKTSIKVFLDALDMESSPSLLSISLLLFKRQGCL